MKPGTRALGIAESYRDEPSGDGRSESTRRRSTLAGVVVRADRVVDGLVFDSCTVGSTDATDGVVSLFRRLGREDVRYVLVAGIALAWYNVLDLRRIHEAVERPVCSVSFEESDGLDDALRAEFSGDDLDERLSVYEGQPSRDRVEVNGHDLYYRTIGFDDGDGREALRAFTPEGGRPEPLRVARLAARAGDGWPTEPADR